MSTLLQDTSTEQYKKVTMLVSFNFEYCTTCYITYVQYYKGTHMVQNVDNKQVVIELVGRDEHSLRSETVLRIWQKKIGPV